MDLCGCGRALRPCEWCGQGADLTVGGQTFLVMTRPDWDGYYHEPCRDAERQLLAPARAASLSRVHVLVIPDQASCGGGGAAVLDGA